MTQSINPSTEAPSTAKAIEFAEYMAKGAEEVLDAINALHAIREEKDQHHDDDEGDRPWESIRAEEDAAEQTLVDHLRGLRSDIYEFRKRAALSPPTVPAAEATARVDAKLALLALAAYFRRVGDLWEGPDGCGTPGTDKCQQIAADAFALASIPMALGLTKIPPFPAEPSSDTPRPVQPAEGETPSELRDRSSEIDFDDGWDASPPPEAQAPSEPMSEQDKRDAARLHWLHSPASNNVDGYEWGIYRVKWVNGKAAEVWQTNGDFSDLDAAINAALKGEAP